MDDRELLELAAKAAGIEPLWYCDGSDVAYYGEMPRHRLFNPLADDGDALRLAVKLGICYGPNFDGDLAVCFGSDGRNITEPYGSDPYAATRRAIVRAAAEIGKELK